MQPKNLRSWHKFFQNVEPLVLTIIHYNFCVSHTNSDFDAIYVVFHVDSNFCLEFFFSIFQFILYFFQY